MPYLVLDYRIGPSVSMKSGLEGRNNQTDICDTQRLALVSMKSGLEGRNNTSCNATFAQTCSSQ